MLVEEILRDETLTSELIVDMYGNYVLQKAVAVAKGENYMKLLRVIIKIYELLSLVDWLQFRKA
jgi:hypothetical protein